MTFSLYHGGVVMANQNMHAQSSNIHLLAYMSGLIISSCALFRDYPNYIM